MPQHDSDLVRCFYSEQLSIHALANLEVCLQQPRRRHAMNMQSLVLQGGFCRQKHSHRNADSKTDPGGRKPGRGPTEIEQNPQTPTGTQGPCLDLRGFCINALTVSVLTFHIVFVLRVYDLI